MKYLLSVLLFFFTALGTRAQESCEPCIKALEKAISLCDKAPKVAMMQFVSIETNCLHCFSDTLLDGWIDKCNKSIIAQDAAFQKKRQAEKAAIEQKEREALERKERLERDRPVFLIVSCAVPGVFERIEYDLEDGLSNQNPDFFFTRDSLEAYWFVRVVVNMFGDQANSEDKHFYYIEADIEVEDATTARVNHNRVLSDKDGTFTIPEERAAEWVANKIYYNQGETFYNKIISAITKHLSR